MMSRERRIIAESVTRLRAYVASGGRPYLMPSGKLAIGSRVPGSWSSGTAQDRKQREIDDRAFFSALRHEDGRRHITRAIRACGRRGPFGHILIGGAA